RRAGAARGPGRARRGAQAVPRVGRRLVRGQALPDVDRARMGNAAGRDAVTERRKYDSPVRRRQAAETRERIIAAGVDILHGFPVWNWRALTVGAVAERAGVNERTVYRHFAG